MTTTTEDHMREITSHRVNPANDKLTIMVEDEPGSGGHRTRARMTRGVEGTHTV